MNQQKTTYIHTDKQQYKPYFIRNSLPEYNRNLSSDINLGRKTKFNSPPNNTKRNKEMVRTLVMLQIPEKDKAFLSLLKENTSADSLAKQDRSRKSSILNLAKPPLPKSISKHKPKAETKTKTKASNLTDDDIKNCDWSRLVRSIVLDNKKINQDSIQEHLKDSETYNAGRDTEYVSYSLNQSPLNHIKPTYSPRFSMSIKHVRIRSMYDKANQES